MPLSELYKLRELLANCAIHGDPSFATCADKLTSLITGGDDTDLQSLLIRTDSTRHSLLTTLWRFVALDWQQNRFQCVSHPLIRTISDAVFGVAERITFSNDRVWFGGVSRCATSSLVATTSSSSTLQQQQEDQSPMRQNAIVYFSLGLILMAYQEDIADTVPADKLELFLDRLQHTYASSPSLFVDALLEHDERLLLTMASIQRIDEQQKLPGNKLLGNFAPAELFLTMLRKIQWDPLVLIDWCSSEPEACFVMLKAYSHRLALLSDNSAQLAQLLRDNSATNKLPDNFELRYDVIASTSVDDSPATHGGNDNKFWTFEVEELHGNQSVQRRIAIPTLSNTTIRLRNPKNDNNSDMEEASPELLGNFCAQLRQKFLRLGPSLHFPTKAICQHLATIVQNLEKQQ